MSKILFFFGHRRLIRNNTQTAVINMAIKRMLKNKVHLLDVNEIKLIKAGLQLFGNNFALYP